MHQRRGRSRHANRHSPNFSRLFDKSSFQVPDVIPRPQTYLFNVLTEQQVLLEQLHRTMWEQVGILRNETGITRGHERDVSGTGDNDIEPGQLARTEN